MMGSKVIDYILCEMPRLTALVGGMSEAQLIIFSLAAISLVVFGYNRLRLKVNGLFSDDEPYEDWMDKELWSR